MKLKLFAAILAGKTVFWLSRLRGNKGTSLPGLVARKFYGDSLRVLAAQVRKEIIVVSGTNGKTTTCNMIVGMLMDAGYDTIANREGANMITGVTTSFILSADMGGNIDCDYAVLEVDEASMPKVLAEVTPSVVVLTNFFRDQLDRYWELDKIIRVIRDALSTLKRATLVLNADDPLVSQFSDNKLLPSVFYGLGKHQRCIKTNSQTREAKFCPYCGEQLIYDYFHYGQLGKYRCPNCYFERPDPFVEVLETVTTKKGMECRLIYDNKDVLLNIRARGLYNVYNAMAALSVGLRLGVDVDIVLESLGKYRTVTGRMESYVYHDKPAFLILVKNPTGFNEAIATLAAAEGAKDVFIAINDNEADGLDISWLWDVDFELLGEESSSYLCFICSGQRGEEIALRLKYAGIPPGKITIDRNIKTAIGNALSGRAGSTYLFTTYTALWPVHKIIKRLATEEIADDQCLSSVSGLAESVRRPR
ncbi:Mur ligase family protein [Pelotomaculum terephthalicicum JT]|uniref:Mur ligase family protein n=1 Tax=Pelotomaculum TaxID=191373 RepID=UPI0009CF2B81|nr:MULTISPECIES: Mur ligase family protein [Pelotomaculum]MCG9968652.1 Mur ligase family protein [Pelotomaculum terephthalicicum JT]OPX85276.1 MAG: UDP-N-acetylmuramate--L-alanine ligase [Pelotomaculum sp. PtaB.Bin117]OPY60409.1 MAG: UDP-N-acetylmuramate--L-alanine ligase [Pelotomaculum sp. PtaU1.Bin065]